MAVEILTREDLQLFRVQLLNDLKQLMAPAPQSQKQWLKSAEVRRLLKISPTTLQRLRINGTLRYSKVGATLYYNYEDILKVLENNGEE
ncbi:MAG TPA: helix-turn-helix domain-containing protein [Flavisolibacter sp.]|nr:helix-turn-helix domain-containing protein [Flavisolibacter sp.]